MSIKKFFVWLKYEPIGGYGYDWVYVNGSDFWPKSQNLKDKL